MIIEFHGSTPSHGIVFTMVSLFWILWSYDGSDWFVVIENWKSNGRNGRDTKYIAFVFVIFKYVDTTKVIRWFMLLRISIHKLLIHCHWCPTPRDIRTESRCSWAQSIDSLFDHPNIQMSDPLSLDVLSLSGISSIFSICEVVSTVVFTLKILIKFECNDSFGEWVDGPCHGMESIQTITCCLQLERKWRWFSRKIAGNDNNINSYPFTWSFKRRIYILTNNTWPQQIITMPRKRRGKGAARGMI